MLWAEFGELGGGGVGGSDYRAGVLGCRVCGLEWSWKLLFGKLQYNGAR